MLVLVNKDTSAHRVTIGMDGKTSGTYEVWATQSYRMRRTSHRGQHNVSGGRAAHNRPGQIR